MIAFGWSIQLTRRHGSNSQRITKVYSSYNHGHGLSNRSKEQRRIDRRTIRCLYVTIVRLIGRSRLLRGNSRAPGEVVDLGITKNVGYLAASDPVLFKSLGGNGGIICSWAACQRRTSVEQRSIRFAVPRSIDQLCENSGVNGTKRNEWARRSNRAFFSSE